MLRQVGGLFAEENRVAVELIFWMDKQGVWYLPMDMNSGRGLRWLSRILLLEIWSQSLSKIAQSMI